MADKLMQPGWDPLVLAAQLQRIAKQSQILMQRFVSNQPDAVKLGIGDTSSLGFDFFKLMTKMMTNPAAVASAQIDLFYGSLNVWQKTAERMLMPRTQEVRRRPLLIVPPWINKFYVLDLQPKNSFIKWAIDQGHTVFVISWVNPDEKLAEKTFENYMIEGPLAALDVIESATGQRSINTIGYCLGGTLLASTAAYLAAKGDGRIASAT